MRRFHKAMCLVLAMLMVLSSLPVWAEGEPTVIIESIETSAPQTETASAGVVASASAHPSTPAPKDAQHSPEPSTPAETAVGSSPAPSAPATAQGLETGEPAVSQAPTGTPAAQETQAPTATPVTSIAPDAEETEVSSTQTPAASVMPSEAPTVPPSEGPEALPSQAPSAQPSLEPSALPSVGPAQTGTPELPMGEISLLSTDDAALYLRSVDEGTPLDIIHLNIYNGYTGALLMEAALVEGGSEVTLPSIPANDAYTHTGWANADEEDAQPFWDASKRTVSFEDLCAEEIHRTTDAFGTIIIDLCSAYTVKNDMPVYRIAFYHAEGRDEGERIGTDVLTLTPEAPEAAHALPDVLPEGAVWVLASADGRLSHELPAGTESITYKDVYGLCSEEMADAEGVYMYIKGDRKDGVILTFYAHGGQWPLEEVGSVRLYAGEGAKAIPQLEERAGYSAYWRGVYGGAYLDGIQFEASASISYEQLMDSLGAAATSLPEAEGGYKRLEVCAYYAPDGTAGTDKPYLQLILTNGGQTVGTVTLAPGETDVPLTYTLPGGVTCAGWSLPGGKGWPADKATVSYSELEALIEAGAETEDVSANCIAIRAALAIAADAETPVILNITIADAEGNESYHRLTASGESVSFPPIDTQLDGQVLAGWRVEYFVGGDLNAPASATSLVDAKAASLSYDEILQMVSVAGIVLDHGLPTLDAYLEPVFERVTEKNVIEVVLDASAWTRSGARVRVYEDTPDEDVPFADGYETYEGYRDDILDNDAGKTLGDDFTIFCPGCSIDGWYAGDTRVLAEAYPTSVSYNDVAGSVTFDEGGFARLVLTPSVHFTGDCTDSEGTAVETTYTVKLLLRDEGYTQTMLLGKGDTIELPMPSAGPGMAFAGWELADGTLFEGGSLTFGQFIAATDSSLISYSTPVYAFDGDGNAISATCEASVELTALYTPSEAAQEGEKRIVITFYGSYDKLLGRRTLSSATPEATYGLPDAEAPEGKVFNGWMLSCGGESLRWYAERGQFSYNDVSSLCPEGGDVTARAIFSADVTPDPTVLRAILYYNDVALDAGDMLYLNQNTTLGLRIGPDEVLGMPITWTSGNETVATVTPMENGALVQAFGASGTVTITARVGSLEPVSVSIFVGKLPTAVSLPAAAEVVAGQSMQFTAILTPTDAQPSTILWSVEPLTGAATVDADGVLTAQAAGQVRLTARTLNGYTASCLVEITNPVHSIVIDPVDAQKAEVSVNANNLVLRATAYGVDGTTNSVQQGVTWKSANTRYARVQANLDGTCTVTGVAAGTVRIYAYATDGTGISGEITVRVIVPVESFHIDPDMVQLLVGDQEQLAVDGLPADATYRYPEDFTWKSADEDIVRVDEHGKLVATGIGETTVTATSHNNITELCYVFVTLPASEVTVTPVDKEKADVNVNSSDLVLRAEAVSAEGGTENVSQGFDWRSGDTGIVQVRANEDGTCTVRGVRAGSARVYAYATDGSSVHGEILVNVIVPITSFYIPESAQLFAGKTVTLRPNGSPADATYRNPEDFTWATSDERVATVEDGVVTGVGYGTAIITATSHNGLTDSCLVTVAIPTEEIHISVASGEKAEVGVDSSNLTLRATALGPNDTSENVPQEFNWMSSNSQIAQVRVNFDGSCSVRGLRTGTVQIYAYAKDDTGVRGAITVHVIVPVTSCWMEPATANLFVGRQLQLRANGTPSNATYHEPADFTWETSDEKVATVSETGLVTGVGEGVATITATSHNGIQATCSVKVTIPVGQIDIELVDAERPDVGIGTAGLRVRAIAYDADGSTTTVSQDIDWRVSNPNYIRIIDNGDGTATVIGLRTGTALIGAFATDGSDVSAQMAVNVIVPVESFDVIPTTATMFAGQTLALKVNGTPTNATYHTPADFTWESSDEEVATVSGTGVVTALGEGEAIITATSHNGIEETCTVYVTLPVSKIEVSLLDGDEAEVDIGKTLRLQAVAYDKDGSTEGVAQTFDWRVSNSNARVAAANDGTATVTGAYNGTVTISAYATDGSGVSGQIEVRVIIPVESFYIVPSSANVNVGRTLSLKVNGKPLDATYHTPSDFAWESDDEDIATVNENGVVTGVSEGVATITATSHNGLQATCEVTVSIRTNAIDISVEGGGKAEVTLGKNDLTLRATALGPDGQPGSVAQDVEWRISNSAYASIHDNGDGTATITGLRAGSLKVAAIAKDGSGIREEIAIRVIVPVESFYIIPSAANVDAGRTLALKVNGKPLNATYYTPADFAWESNDRGVATVDENGVVTGVSEGVATITATSHNGLQATCKVSVGIRTTSIRITVEGGGDADVSLGQGDLTLRATALGPDGQPGSVAQDIEWRISNSAYASIRDNGDGTATITGRRVGSLKVAAIAKDGSGVRAEIPIRVIVPVESFYIIPSAASIVTGESLSLKVNGRPLDATYYTPADFTWESNKEGVATVNENGVVTGKGEGVAIITATSHNGLQATCEVSVGIRTNAIDISVEGGGRAEVSLDESDLTLRATAIGPDGKPDTSVQDFEWRISNTSYATIRDNGDGTATITGRRTGYVKVAAIAKDGSGIREEISIRVIIPVEECWMEPVSNAGLFVGETLQLLVNGLPVDATYQSPTDFAWKSSDADVATVDENGLVNAVGYGVATITATSHNGIGTACEIVVSVPVDHIEISLAEADEAIAEVGGAPLRLQAIGYDKDGSAENIAQSFEWSSSNSAVATVTAGEDGAAEVTGLQPGIVTITATAKDGTGTRQAIEIQVIAPVTDFTIPEAASVFAGGTYTLPLNVSPGNATYGSRDDFDWVSDNDEIVTVDGNGVLHGVSLGTATITATSHNGIEKKCSVTVTNAAERVEVAPVDAEAAEVATGAGLLLGAVAYGKDDVTEDVAQTFTWTSSNISIATVEAGEGGEATIRGIRPGTVTITATVTDGTGVQGTCPVKVIVAVRDFTIPETAYVVMDAEMTLPLSVSPDNATYKSHADFTWESGDDEILTVDGSGVIHGVSLGTAIVTATSHNGIEKQCTVTVTKPIHTVAVSPTDPEAEGIIVGETDLVLKAVASDEDEGTGDVAQGFTWSSSDPSIATVEAGEDTTTATVTGLRPGTARIIATSTDGSGINGSYTVTVDVAPAGLALPEEEVLPLGETLDLGALLAFAPEEATLTGVTWESGDDDIATVNDEGVVTSHAAGEVRITATSTHDPEVSAACTVYVKTAPASIGIVPVGDHIPYDGSADTVILYIPNEGNNYVHHMYDSVTFDIQANETGLTDVKWQVLSNASRVSAVRNDDDTFTITAHANSLSSPESSAEVTIRAVSAHNSNVMASYRILLARGISQIGMNDMYFDYNTTASFRVPQPNIVPANATFRNSSDFVWKSSDPSIVSVTEGGYCTINGVGTAYISMCPKYDSGYIANGSPDVTGGFSVTVLKTARTATIYMLDNENNVMSMNSGTVPRGGYVQLLAVAKEAGYEEGTEPAAGQRFTWSVSNTNYASVKLDDGETGLCLLETKRNGTVTVTATTQDGSGVKATFTLRIVDPLTGISGIPTELVLHVGETYSFNPSPIPANSALNDFFWHDIPERKAHIASMEGNTVTALSPGTVTLTVAPENHGPRADGSIVSAQCKVTVVSDDPATVRIDGAKDGQTLLVGDMLGLTATVLAENGSSEGVDQGVTWQLSNNGVLSYDAALGQYKAVAPGSVTITATADGKGADGEAVSQSITVYVGSAKITGIPEKLTLFAGEDYIFQPALEPADDSAIFIWDALREEDEAVLSMVGDTVTTIAPGTVQLTLRAQGMDGFATCTVTVSERPSSIVLDGLEEGQRIAMGDTIQLAASVLNADGNTTGIPQDVIWDCSNWDILDIENGLVTAYSMGNVTITATSAADPGVQASVTVYVGMDKIEGVPAELTLHAGDTYTFEPTLSGSADGLVWRALSEADGKTVSMDGNKLTALSEGSAKVTVESEGLKGLIASCNVTVLAAEEGGETED